MSLQRQWINQVNMCLVEAIEKEANSARRTVDETRQVLQAKEAKLVRLESKFESFSSIDNRAGGTISERSSPTCIKGNLFHLLNVNVTTEKN
ncbi:unnamed protein product [Calypogeia fissa]